MKARKRKGPGRPADRRVRRAEPCRGTEVRTMSVRSYSGRLKLGASCPTHDLPTRMALQGYPFSGAPMYSGVAAHLARADVPRSQGCIPSYDGHLSGEVYALPKGRPRYYYPSAGTPIQSSGAGRLTPAETLAAETGAPAVQEARLLATGQAGMRRGGVHKDPLPAKGTGGPYDRGSILEPCARPSLCRVTRNGSSDTYKIRHRPCFRKVYYTLNIPHQGLRCKEKLHDRPPPRRLAGRAGHRVPTCKNCTRLALSGMTR